MELLTIAEAVDRSYTELEAVADTLYGLPLLGADAARAVANEYVRGMIESQFRMAIELLKTVEAGLRTLDQRVESEGGILDQEQPGTAPG